MIILAYPNPEACELPSLTPSASPSKRRERKREREMMLGW
tara:strand:+ start:947 stop:1066 length:120 start_codon:yes stop_codon:yes gene_type:complete